MEAVACRLQAEGHEVLMMQEQDWQGEKADLVMTMGRKADVLKELEHSGMRVINAPAAIRT
jgi:glutathione synthase/RimK-type ligase-like ATP-grasp enzyme